ncbi:hypothetical protein PR202_ga02316 [Eleusine coracana subsp. coracana]|uniref:Uncharacterized protein n=1 Tax=Eleusine coracana subsp. coracana TaxID=191504 RepID=A0AAV5BLC6_ELECO|nr:hypothetical protein PR202_ga02316 [Eleusine coracana subsp. coracana]
MTTAAFPNWIMLERFVFRRDDEESFPNAPISVRGVTSCPTPLPRPSTPPLPLCIARRPSLPRPLGADPAPLHLRLLLFLPSYEAPAVHRLRRLSLHPSHQEPVALALTVCAVGPHRVLGGAEVSDSLGASMSGTECRGTCV